MTLDKEKKVKKDITQSAEGPSPVLVSDLPPELPKDEALTPGVLKLLLREEDKNDKRIRELEQNYECLMQGKMVVEKENVILKTKLGYSIIWDILITMAGISGGGVIATWGNNKGIPIFLGILTILLFSLAILGRKK